MNERTKLSQDMHALADTGHSRAEELREYADKFDAAVSGWIAEPQTVTVAEQCAAWVRARRLYCECSGKDMLD